VTTLAPAGAAELRAATAFHVVLSDRGEDVDQALALIHDAFVEAGYMLPQPSGRRLHPAYLNPGTYFGIAHGDDEPVGAMAMVSDGPFGLPSERAFAEEIDALRASVPAELFEGGSLAVAAAQRRHTRRVFTLLMAAVARTEFDEHPDASVVFTVPPEGMRFYTALYGCQVLSEPRPLYGAPAVLLTTDCPTLRASFARELTSAQRTMRVLTDDDRPDWLLDCRRGRLSGDAWLFPLLDEQGLTGRLSRQLGLLGALSPAVLSLIQETAA
jgi:hypothetical protein